MGKIILNNGLLFSAWKYFHKLFKNSNYENKSSNAKFIIGRNDYANYKLHLH